MLPSQNRKLNLPWSLKEPCTMTECDYGLVADNSLDGPHEHTCLLEQKIVPEGHQQCLIMLKKILGAVNI